MKVCQFPALVATAFVLLAPIATAQEASPSDRGASRPEELRDLEYWAGDIWQRLSDLPVTAPVRGGHRVVVKIPQTGNNIEADVYVISPRSIDPATYSWLHDHFLEDTVAVIASRLGTRYHTDAQGIVHVDMPKDGVCLAIAGDRIGRRQAQAKTTYVGVLDHVTLRAEVLDAEGRPAANVPVRVGHVTPGTQFASGCTDRSGRIVARVPKNTIKQQLLLQAAIAGPDRGATLVPEDYFERAPTLLQLKLPQTGLVELHIDDPIGVLPDECTRATLRWFVDDRPDTHRPIPPTAWANGKAVFAHVAPGMTVEAHATGTSSTVFKAKAAGPSTGSSTSTLTVSIGTDLLVLRGRLLGNTSDDKLGTRSRVRISGLRQVREVSMQLDADQRFLVAIDASDLPASDVRLAFFASTPNTNEPARVAVAEIAGDRRGVVDLGDLPLITERVIVRGRVLSGGKPMQARISAPLAHDPQGPDGHHVSTDKDGRFTLHEATPANGTLPLRISYGWPPRMHEETVRLGEHEQVIELPTGHSLAVTVRDRRFLPMLIYEAIPHGGGGRSISGHATADGCTFPNLQAAPYDLVIRLGGHLLARIDKVDATQAQPDPRCQNIAWQQELKSARLHITSPTGQPLRANGYVATGNNRNSLWAVSDADGNVELPYADGDTFFVRHSGYRGMIVPPAAGVLEVRMLPCATLHLRLPDGLTLPADVELHFDSELQQFGLKDLVHDWRPTQPNAVRPEARQRTRLRVVARHLDRTEAVLHEQTIALPLSGGPIEILIGIDEDDASFAADLATARAQRK